MSLRFILYFWYSNRTYLMYRRIKTTTGSKKIYFWIFCTVLGTK